MDDKGETPRVQVLVYNNVKGVTTNLYYLLGLFVKTGLSIPKGNKYVEHAVLSGKKHSDTYSNLPSTK